MDVSDEVRALAKLDGPQLRQRWQDLVGRPAPSVSPKLLRLALAVATAHGWWEELLQNPERRISDLARTHGLTKSWITRTLRLAFLDPAITEMILAGKAPAHLTQRALRSEESVPALWADQRALYRINASI